MNLILSQLIHHKVNNIKIILNLTKQSINPKDKFNPSNESNLKLNRMEGSNRF